MAELENVLETTDYDGVQLNEYKGKFSVNATTIGQNDVKYLKWVFDSKWSKANSGWVPGDKTRPMHIVLGDRNTAISALKDLIRQIEG